MAVTLTTSYRETLNSETVDLIDSLLDDNYELSDMLEFIDENSEDDFVAYYEEYCEQGEKIGYDVVDAFVKENGFCDVEHCEEAFVGTYQDGAHFAEEYLSDCGDEIPAYVVVDWDATWSRSLCDDFDFVEGDGYRTGYVFRKYY